MSSFFSPQDPTARAKDRQSVLEFSVSHHKVTLLTCSPSRGNIATGSIYVLSIVWQSGLAESRSVLNSVTATLRQIGRYQTGNGSNLP